MSPKQDAPDVAELEEANAKLKQSLERCRELLSECRSKLVANSADEASERKSA